MSSADTHKALHEYFNRRDFDAIAARFAQDGVYIDQARGVSVKGAAEFVSYLKEWTTALSDAAVTEARYLDAGSTSVALFVGKGTNDGPMGPFPATGRTARFPICELLTYDHKGTVTGGELYYDQATILAELGHIQLPAG